METLVADKVVKNNKSVQYSSDRVNLYCPGRAVFKLLHTELNDNVI